MSTAELRARAFFLNCRLRQWPAAQLKCRSRYIQQHQRHFHRNNVVRQSHDSRFRPYYVTSPIFYVNAEPHVGHLYTLLLTDVLKRWEVLKGDTQAALLTGTDEHGMKVQKAAQTAGVPPKDLCDKNSRHFHALAEAANISFDRFIRTTDADHKRAVEHFWRELKSRGYIYESKHEGWYSVSDETFYPETQIHLVLDPATGRKLYASKETGKEVEWTSEINYRFRLSAFKDRLLEHYDQHPDFIVPVERMNAIQQEVRNGLDDLSVSRPSARLQWGIPVPDDGSQTIYVWLDALINYLTMTGYPSGDGDRHKLWPPNAQVIGKDIIRFHTIYWPAFLMALDIPLPRAFLTHAHWTLGNAKMSKSLGNGVNPFLAMERYGLDTIRYFMVHDGGMVNDANYENSLIVERYKKALQGQLGNLLSRLLRGSKWSIGRSLAFVRSSSAPEISRPEAVDDMIAKINTTATAADEAMTRLNPRAALHVTMELIYDANKFWENARPWDLAKSADPDTAAHLHQVVYTAAETLRVACILLQPFMPSKMTEALNSLRVAEDMRHFQHAVFGGDMNYGDEASETEHASRNIRGRDRYRRSYDRVLFPPLIAES